MSRRFMPQRRLRSEIIPLALAVAAPIVLFLFFPADALRPLSSASEKPSVASCAFVTLTPAQERQALAAARTAWQLNRRTTRQMRIDLFAESLPPLPQRPVSDVSAYAKTDRDASKPYSPDPLPPTLAAPPPAQIPSLPDADKPVPAFSREELLKLN